jgi:hypothetical protein
MEKEEMEPREEGEKGRRGANELSTLIYLRK